MKRNSLKVIIVLVIILIILVIVTLLVFLKKNTNDSNMQNEIDQENTVEEEEITRYEANQYYRMQISAVDSAKSYLSSYCNTALTNPKEAYNLLDAQYKEKRFHNQYDQYQDYINKIKSRLLDTKLEGYSIIQRDEYKEFRLTDNYGTNYLVREYAVMDYTIELDNYTIPSEELIKQYETADQKTKVMTQLDIFFQMLNTKDYSHAYDLLDATFRQNNFSTQEQFEQYVTVNFFDYNKITLKEQRNEGELFVYDLSIQNGKTQEQKEKRFLIKLTNNNSCVMSFEV